MTRFLKAEKLEDLLFDLNDKGLSITASTDADGNITEPTPFTTAMTRDGATAVYLGHVPIEPAEYDEDGNETKAAVYSPDFHANVTGTTAEFETEMSEPPTTPYNIFAE